MQSTDHYRNIKETYKVEQTVGRGSTATVKRIKHRQTQEKFAVKVFSKRKMTEDDVQSLKAEIEIMKQIDHPNIVRLIDVFEDERHYCLVMELMTGGELFDKIIAVDQFSEVDARQCAIALIDAIRYCHDLGILHRDIKPENLLLQSAELGISSLKVADFGLSRQFSEDDVKKLASTACGTPSYLAPEVLRQEKYGKACDHWSVGIVVFVLLSGTMPFYQEDSFELFEAIKNCNYKFESPTWENVSDEGKDFVKRILVSDPKERLDFEQMMEHPWMKIDLTNRPLQYHHQMESSWQSVKIMKKNSQQLAPDDISPEIPDEKC